MLASISSLWRRTTCLRSNRGCLKGIDCRVKYFAEPNCLCHSIWSIFRNQVVLQRRAGREHLYVLRFSRKPIKPSLVESNNAWRNTISLWSWCKEQYTSNYFSTGATNPIMIMMSYHVQDFVAAKAQALKLTSLKGLRIVARNSQCGCAHSTYWQAH